MCFDSCISSEKKIRLQCPCQGLRQIFRKNRYVLTYVLKQFKFEFHKRGFKKSHKIKMTYFILKKNVYQVRLYEIKKICHAGNIIF